MSCCIAWGFKIVEGPHPIPNTIYREAKSFLALDLLLTISFLAISLIALKTSYLPLPPAASWSLMGAGIFFSISTFFLSIKVCNCPEESESKNKISLVKLYYPFLFDFFCLEIENLSLKLV